jgi:DNA-directed RNA polymerase subunit M
MKKAKHISKKAPKRHVAKPKRAKAVSKTVSKPAAKAPVIEFCDKCGSILVPIKKGSETIMKCRGCGRQAKKEVRVLKIVEEKKHEKGVLILEKDPTLLPLTDKACPKCEHSKAYWWMQQTRSADEPPTQFFRCEKCKHTWREYK